MICRRSVSPLATRGRIENRHTRLKVSPRRGSARFVAMTLEFAACFRRSAGDVAALSVTQGSAVANDQRPTLVTNSAGLKALNGPYPSARPREALFRYDSVFKVQS